MSSVMPARRRAEKFNEWVEGNASASLNDARILEVVSTLRSVEAPALRADFAADLRERLMVEAETALVRTPQRLLPGTPAPTQRRTHRRLAVAAGALAVVGATTSISLAAQSALPGDALYPIKRAIEDAQTGLASGDAKTEEMLSNAASRLSEATALADRDTPESHAAVASTLEDFVEQAQAAADLALASGNPQLITQLRDFAATSMIELEILDSVLPEELHSVVSLAAKQITRIDRRALAECPSCGGAVIDLPPIFLASASTRVTSGRVVAPTAPQVVAPAPALPTISLPDLSTAEAPEPSSQPSDAGDDDGSEQPPLIPDDDDSTAKTPIEILGDAVEGGVATGSTSPVAPVTGPLVDAVEDAVTDVTGATNP